MTVKNVSNLSASVHARLQNHARATKRPFQELLQYYAMERFLYRLAPSRHPHRFVLKGAIMPVDCRAPATPPKLAIDLLGRRRRNPLRRRPARPRPLRRRPRLGRAGPPPPPRQARPTPAPRTRPSHGRRLRRPPPPLPLRAGRPVPPNPAGRAGERPRLDGDGAHRPGEAPETRGHPRHALLGAVGGSVDERLRLRLSCRHPAHAPAPGAPPRLPRQPVKTFFLEASRQEKCSRARCRSA